MWCTWTWYSPPPPPSQSHRLCVQAVVPHEHAIVLIDTVLCTCACVSPSRSLIAFAFKPSSLTNTLIFKASSSDVLMLLEDDEIIHSGGQVQEFIPLEGFVMAVDTSVFIAAIAGIAPGVVVDVTSANANAMVRRTDLITESVRDGRRELVARGDSYRDAAVVSLSCRCERRRDVALTCGVLSL